MKRNTYYAIAASVLIFCTIINYGMSNLGSGGYSSGSWHK